MFNRRIAWSCVNYCLRSFFVRENFGLTKTFSAAFGSSGELLHELGHLIHELL